MGSASKIILVGATSLIVGIYAVSLKKVQTNDIKTALVEVKRVQFERVQSAAVRTAIDKFLYYGGYDISPVRGAQLGGDTTYTSSFTATDSGKSSNLSMTVYSRNRDNVLVPRTIIAKIENLTAVKQGPRRIHRGTWQVTQYYVQREH